MNDDTLRKKLEERRAAVVHFSHHAKMREGGVFPADLQAAIANKDDWPLSCSVLWPGHGMELCGSVGVMFTPSVVSVQSVSNTDSGSWANPDGRDQSGGEPLTAESFEKTFEVVGAYNEWRIRGAIVAGIFVHNLHSILVKKHVSVPGLPDGEILIDIGATTITLSEVFVAFPALPIFTMAADGLVEVPRSS